jgi:hypothetical protein
MTMPKSFKLPARQNYEKSQFEILNEIKKLGKRSHKILDEINAAISLSPNGTIKSISSIEQQE